MREKKVRVKRRIENGLFVDAETGEQINLAPLSRVYVEEIKDAFILENKKYVSITPEAIEYLTTHCMKTDISKILKISATTKTNCNAAFTKNNIPHNIETLSNYLQLNKRELYRLLNRLTKQNILAYAVCSPSGYMQKIVMLNPYLATRRTTFAGELKAIFRDITKDTLSI
jgi:hypothetical protein